ncbi:MAG: hypothetical protein ACI38Q_04810 [Candidatus Bruticola sp.]
MSQDIFNPNLYNSAAEVLSVLHSENININHRLGARLCSLGRRSILFSMAFLEEAAESSDFADCLRDKRWNSLEYNDIQGANALLKPLGAWAEKAEEALVVRTEDESPAEVLGEAKAIVAAGSVAPKVLGEANVSAIKGVLWERSRLEEASLTLLDSENISDLIEAFRYLFRASAACHQDPTPLLITAFKRGKAELSREAAKQVRDNLNRDLGRALLSMLSLDIKKFKDALFYFDQPEQEKFHSILGTILLSALLPLVKEKNFRTQLLPGLPHLAPLIAKCAAQGVEEERQAELSELTAFLDALLDQLDSFELTERFALSAFVFDLAPHFPGLGDYLMRRLKNTNIPGSVAFFGNILSRLPKTDEDYQFLSKRLLQLFLEHGQEVGLSRRLRATFKNLGSAILEELSAPFVLAELDESRRIFVVNLWSDFRSAQEENEHCSEHHHTQEACTDPGCHHHHIDDKHEEEMQLLLSEFHKWAGSCTRGEALNSVHMEKVFADFVIGRLLAQDRASVLALVRTHQLDLPKVREALQNLDSKWRFAYSFLFNEACNLDEPDNLAVLSLLASCGQAALEFSFKAVSEDAALESGGEALKAGVFARLLHCQEMQNEAFRPEIENMVRQVLDFPSLKEAERLAENKNRQVVSAVWQSLGFLGSVPLIGSELRMMVVQRISEKLSDNPSPKVEALFDIYRASTVAVRLEIERIFAQVLSAVEPDRRLLHCCLQGLVDMLQDGPMLADPEAFVAMLCRTVLKRGQEPSLNDLMKQVLSSEAEGDGVQNPQAWDHADRMLALRIIGAAACHPQAGERLHQMFVFRLFSFLEDWFEGVERGKNLYAYRGNPIWSALSELLRRDLSNFTLNLARRSAMRLIGNFKKHLEGCDLTQSESAQKFLLSVLEVSRETKIIFGGLSVEVDRSILSALVEVVRNSPPENKSALFLLENLAKRRVLSDYLQEDLEIFLALREQHS